uniref:Palmitoyltransferase n=1 Tax=Clastoptera arizonana TaxID=38151 RepID=A0A1B6DFT8_9HEMI
MKLRKRKLPRNPLDFVSFIFVMVTVPILYWFMVFTVLPSTYPTHSFWYTIHLSISTFLMMNVTSNFVYMVLQDCSILGEVMPTTKVTPEWKFCTICETYTPPRSYHCNVCKICILKRDHHCQFASCCIGYHNQRYFLYFLFYITVATSYGFYFYTIFLMKITTLTVNNILKFIFPLAMFTFGIDLSIEQVYITIYVVNILCFMTSSVLFMYHINSALQGITMYERNHKIYDYKKSSLKENFIDIVGDRWHLTWLSPLIVSRLPHDGINWIKNKINND